MKRSLLNSLMALLLLALGVIALGVLLVQGRNFDGLVLICGGIACLDTLAASFFIFSLR
ncbi:MAG TPA: hypothetical protein VKR06_40685 [Ktedonosporobacter sp.]|nr:hypothetical protein [Ktedonosporobacter sp.]